MRCASGTGTRGIGDLVRFVRWRCFGVQTTLAAASNRMLAGMAAALTPPGQMRVVEHDPAAVRSFLRPRPAGSLLGVGPATAKTLTRHGLHTVGELADTPLLTVQRLLGAATGRTLHERAHGRDECPVATEPVARSTSAEHRFDRDELDPAQHRRTLLPLTGQLGTRMRIEGQVAAVLAITVRYADGTTTTRSRPWPSPRTTPRYWPTVRTACTRRSASNGPACGVSRCGARTSSLLNTPPVS